MTPGSPPKRGFGFHLRQAGRELRNAAGTFFRGGYDGADPAPTRRKKVFPWLGSADTTLDDFHRKILVTNTRDLRQNFSAAAWAIRKHLDYVAKFTFQSKTGDTGLDRDLEFLVRDWCRAKNCDVACRHSLQRLTRIAEAGRTVDGDLFAVKLADGKLQAIEGDRVRNPNDRGADKQFKDWTHGVKTNAEGRALQYAVCRREGAGFKLDRVVDAGNVFHHGYFERIDQVRGVSPLASAVNEMRDTYEELEFARARMKIAQLFGLVFYKEQQLAPEVASIDTNTGEAADTDTDEYSVDWGKGPFQVTLDPGDKATFLENKTNADEFISFTKLELALALKSLDIPYSFFDESFTNYSGARQALLQYEDSAQTKRADNECLLDDILEWRLQLWILDGTLTLPASFAKGIDDMNWEWIAAGKPWIDPIKEATAASIAIDRGISSTVREAKERGLDAYDLALEEAKYLEHRKTLGLPLLNSTAVQVVVSADAPAGGAA